MAASASSTSRSLDRSPRTMERCRSGMVAGELVVAAGCDEPVPADAALAAEGEVVTRRMECRCSMAMRSLYEPSRAGESSVLMIFAGSENFIGRLNDAGRRAHQPARWRRQSEGCRSLTSEIGKRWRPVRSGSCISAWRTGSVVRRGSRREWPAPLPRGATRLQTPCGAPFGSSIGCKLRVVAPRRIKTAD